MKQSRSIFLAISLLVLPTGLSLGQVYDVTSFGATGKVIFGATVDLCDEDDGAEMTYQIVGEDEADIAAGMISIGSPIARAAGWPTAGRASRRPTARGSSNRWWRRKRCRPPTSITTSASDGHFDAITTSRDSVPAKSPASWPSKRPPTRSSRRRRHRRSPRCGYRFSGR